MSTLTDDTDFRTYCALDALSTRHCKPSLVSDMKEYNVLDFYNRIVHPLSKIVAGMNRRGVWVDQSAREAAVLDLEEKIKERQEELNAIAGRELNVSGDDLRNFLYVEVGLPYPFRRPWETKRSTNKETLLALKEHVPEVAPMLDAIIELRKFTTFKDTFLAVGDDVDESGRVHPQFRIGPVTGRLACIAKGTKILTVGDSRADGVPIEDIKLGDLVYCYDKTDPTRLRISRVSGFLYRGKRRVIRIRYQGQGNREFGSLVLTPDHRVRLTDGSWVEAQHLTKKDRLLSLKRGSTSYGYHRLYARQGTIKESRFIGEEVLGAKDGDHVHHKNELKWDNRPENLEVLDESKHLSHHGQNTSVELRELRSRNAIRLHAEGKIGNRLSGVKSPNWQGLSKYQCLRLLAKMGGRPTILKGSGIDSGTFKKKCRLHGINLQNVKMRYTSYGVFVSRGLLRRLVRDGYTITSLQVELNKNYYHLEYLLELYGLQNNHVVISIEELPDETEVYDLTVEDHENFIANEICSHNCKKPDFHNVPDGIPRSIYAAPPGRILIGADYSQVEFRIFAILGNCIALLEGFARGEDAHTINTKIIMGRNDIEHHKLFKKIRTVIKRFSFGMIYGGKLATLIAAVREAFNLLGETVSEAQVQGAVERFFTLNPEAQAFMTDCRVGTLATRMMYNRFGRLRIFFGPKRDVPGEAGNYPMQSGAGDLINTRMIKIDPVIPESIIIQVHDSLVLEVDEEEGEEWMAEVKETMEEAIPEFGGYQFPVSIKLGRNWAEV